MIYGNPAYAIEDDQTDRVGLRTVAISKMWQPSRKGLSTLEILAEVPAPPAMPGGVAMMGSQTRRAGGVMRTLWIYQGINGDGRTVTFRDRQNTNDYGFQPGFAQVGIELSPRFGELYERFGGYYQDGQFHWPRTYSNQAGSGLSGGGSQEQEKPNPMFGHTDFLRMEGTYSCRYLSTTLGVAFSGVEQIHTSGSLPGVAPSFPNRNWLKLPPAYERRGPVFEIVESFWLSGPGGWPEPIYGVLSRRGAGGGLQSSGGLQTGSL